MAAFVQDSLFPKHVTSMWENISEVRLLIDYHSKLVGKTRGRKHGVEVLNKSAIVLLVAAWQAYVEEISISGFEIMLNAGTDHNVFPHKVLTMASSPLVESQDKRDIWFLAGDGWKTIMQNHKKEILSKHLQQFNTPSIRNVSGLLENLLGLNSYPSKIKWHRMTPDNANKKLEKLIKTRGDIAHKVKTSNSVTKKEVLDAVTFIYRISAITSNCISRHIEKRTGETPWNIVTYNNVG